MNSTAQTETQSSTVACSSCQKPLRKDGGFYDRVSGARWHESCPDPKEVA